MLDRVALIFPPWGEEKVTLGVWSRFAIAAGTRHQAEARAFLRWLVSGDRLLRYDMTVPGHMIPPLRSVQHKALHYESPYVKQHSHWLQTFQEWTPYTNHPAMNMGSMQEGHFRRVDTAPPWGDAVFSASGVIGAMLQEITLGGQTPEAAWQRAVAQLQEVVSEWKTHHPDWQPSSCP
jgi:ABC-type glycerol-3-phosphate transport system substrate-binding protein